MARRGSRLRASDHPRGGFALPLAIALLIALSLASALVVDAALATLRTGVALSGQSRVNLLAESALAEALGQRLDSAALVAPPGVVLFAWTGGGVDTVTATARAIGGDLIEVTVSAISRRAGVRAFAGRAAFLRLERAPDTPAEVRVRPAAENWWVSVP